MTKQQFFVKRKSTEFDYGSINPYTDNNKVTAANSKSQLTDYGPQI